MEHRAGMYPPHRHAAAIFDNLYEVIIPYVFSRSQEHFELRGSFITGVREIDEMVKTDKVRVKRTLVDIMKIVHDGGGASFVHKKEVKEAYTALTEYVRDWEERYGGTVHTLPPDMKEMLTTFKATAADLETIISDPVNGMALTKKREAIGIGSLMGATNRPVSVPSPDIAKHRFDSIGKLVRRNSRRY